MDYDEKECEEKSESVKSASHESPKAITVDFDVVDKFCAKITALFLPYLPENIPEKEWLRFHGKIEECFREFAEAHFLKEQGRDQPCFMNGRRTPSVRRKIYSRNSVTIL